MGQAVNVSEDPGQRHPRLYFDTAVYEVEDVLFRIPTRYFHEKSVIFGAAAQISVGHEGEEGSDEHPISLTLPYSAKADDFTLVVKIIIALDNNLPAPSDYTIDRWLSVLKLSTFWEFEDIRTLAIQRLFQDTYGLPITLPEWLRFLDFSQDRTEFSDLREDVILHISQYPFTLPKLMSVLEFTSDKHQYSIIRAGAMSHISQLQPPYAIGDWIPVLEFAMKEPGFSDLKDIAISRLSMLIGDDFTKVKLGKKYRIEPWFLGGLEALANRDRLPSFEEVEGLGSDIALRLLWLRDSRVINSKVKSKGKFSSISSSRTRSVFGEDFLSH